MAKQLKLKKKPKRYISIVLGAGLATFSMILLFNVYKEISITLQLKKELNDAMVELEKVNEENSLLTSQKDRLDDPNFVQSYARGNHMLSKEGEKIFYLPQSKPVETSVPEEDNQE